MREIISALMVGLFSLSCFAETATDGQGDSKTPAKTWETDADGVHFSLTQILPEQLQAFYISRGFTLKEIAPFASSCVYMTVLRNDTAPGTIHYVRDNWQILVDGKRHRLVSVDEWVNRLAATSNNKAALVAFRWAQFPPEQTYEPGGDWNQGMLSVGLTGGSQFDAIARWDIGGKVFEAKLEGVECAK